MEELQSRIESLLFLEARPMTLKKLAKACSSSVSEVEEATKTMQQMYAEREGGVTIVRDGNNVQIMTSKDNADFVRDYLEGEEAGELTRPSLETLTIIAYRGPVSKTEIELIRGVNCSLILRNLLIRGLAEQVGETETGSPVYRVTLDFLRFLGLNKVADLPNYEELNKNEHLQEMLESRRNSNDFFQNPEAGQESAEMNDEEMDDDADDEGEDADEDDGADKEE